MIARMGRPREKHKSLPPGFRQVKGRWYWRPTDETTRQVAAQLGRGSVPTGETSVDGARRWYVSNILPKIDTLAPTCRIGVHVADILDLYDHAGMGGIAERTADEYRKMIPSLKEKFGAMAYAKTQTLAEMGDFIRAHHIQQWLRSFKGKRGETYTKRKIAVLSSAFNYAINEGWTVYNPALDVDGRSTRTKRERYIADAETSAVYGQCNAVTQLLIEWIYKTAQRYEDILRFGPADLVDVDGQQYLLNPNSKTEQKIYIRIDSELRTLIERTVAVHHKGARKVVSIAEAPAHRRTTFFCTRAGAPYTASGIASQFDRARAKTGVADFSLRDLRGKAATDMFAAGVPLTQIQKLLGHTSPETTQIYIKQYSPSFADTNQRALWRAA